jgi:SAM-dependent methyltransferase
LFLCRPRWVNSIRRSSAAGKWERVSASKPQASSPHFPASGELPWDTGEPEPLLVEFVAAGRVRPTQTLEIGAGTGTNALWLAERGFDVLGIDVAPLAVERATAKLNGRALRCRFATRDFLAADSPDGPFDFVFDRGCFHIFDQPEERARFAVQVAAMFTLGRVGTAYTILNSARNSGSTQDRRVVHRAQAE